MTNVLNFFKTNGELWSNVSYESNGWTFDSRNPSDSRRGVYAFVSEFGIEKVGKIENANGVKARTYQYMNSKSRINRDKSDQSDRLWEEVMTTELRGKNLQFYFIHCPSTLTEFNGIQIENDIIRPLEKQLSIQARSENNPMRLSGAGN